MIKLLFISANPNHDLDLRREAKDVRKMLEGLEENVKGFTVEYYPEIDIGELQDKIAKHKPDYVHFCGHGAGKQGLVFEDKNGKEEIVSTEVLVNIFETFSEYIECVVLNACDSCHQAKSIVKYINHVVGMSQPIIDQAAHEFALGFYTGLATGNSIDISYKMGQNQILIWSRRNSQPTQSRKAHYMGPAIQPTQSVQEYLKPVLLKRSELSFSTGVDLDEVIASSALPDLPPKLKKFVQDKSSCKEYKDFTRDAYDNFGQFSAENVATPTKSAYAQRKIVVGKVKEFWIKGFLKPSLEENTVFQLDLTDRPEAIADLSKGIEALSVDLDDSYDELRDTQIYQEMGQGRTLLILGDPGAGKTIALLQLAQRLIERSEKNWALPLPIVFNLSSWAHKSKPIIDWLIDELREKYQVPKSISEPWIRGRQIILLLDGLDEVNEDYRNECVRALNKFIGLFPEIEIAVCSRVKDYEALTERLQISSALCLQPLSSKQIYESLDRVGGALAGLKALLKQDADLEQFAQTPLILNLMSSAYQGWSVKRLAQELGSTADRNQHLFDTYIDHQLEQGAASDYRPTQIRHWLSWLASRMKQEKQTIFLIEKLQPTWLKDRGEVRVYQISTFIIVGLSAGLSAGLGAGLSAGSISEPIYGPFPGLTFGLFVGLNGGLVVLSQEEISPLEKFSWSWQRARVGLISGLISGLFVGLFSVLVNGLGSELFFELFIVLGIGLFMGLGFGLTSGLGSSEMVQRTVPNQGIRTSLKNGIFVGLVVWLIFGLIFGLFVGLDSGLIFGLIFGPIAGLSYGGAACIQHFTLRQVLRQGQVLRQERRIPWNYARFLDFASDRLLMKKVGGGYVFFHRMLLEHFAHMSPR